MPYMYEQQLTPHPFVFGNMSINVVTTGVVWCGAVDAPIHACTTVVQYLDVSDVVGASSRFSRHRDARVPAPNTGYGDAAFKNNSSSSRWVGETAPGTDRVVGQKYGGQEKGMSGEEDEKISTEKAKFKPYATATLHTLRM